MDDKSKSKYINILMRAMQAETDGHLFYKSAADKTKDPVAQEVFESLAKDELDHLLFLKTQHKSILETGEPDENAELRKPSGELEKSPVFSDDFKSRIDRAHHEMSALSIGIHLELAQMDFYKNQTNEATHPFIKTFLGELAEWETSHYRRLIRQQEELQEDYWYKGGFYPY